MESALFGMHLKLENLSKSFGTKTVLQNINLEVEPGEFLAVIGRSGCGKSTMLRSIAGLDRPSSGHVWLDNRRCDRFSENEKERGTSHQVLRLFRRWRSQVCYSYGI